MRKTPRWKRYNLRHPERRKESYTKYSIKNKEIIAMKRNLPENKYTKKRSELVKAYGITFDDFLKMVEKQKGCCAICSREFVSSKHTHIDHDHKNKKVREILCSKCNVGIGNFEEDIDRMLLAIAYIKKWQ